MVFYALFRWPSYFISNSSFKLYHFILGIQDFIDKILFKNDSIQSKSTNKFNDLLQIDNFMAYNNDSIYVYIKINDYYFSSFNLRIKYLNKIVSKL